MKSPSKKVTIREIANEAKVSITTVSYVLNNRGSIGEEVRKRVFDTAKKLGYSQNRAARAMKTGKSQIIGLVVPNMENPFFARLSKAVFNAAQDQGYLVFLAGTEGHVKQQDKAIKQMAQQGVDGMIVFPVNESVGLKSEKIGCPVVSLDRNIPQIDLIQAQYYEGGRMLAEHLLELGHKKVGLVNGPTDVSSSRNRIQGFIETMGKKARVAWETENPYTHELTEKTRNLIKSRKVTAIVCGNDQIAIGALSYCQHLSLKVPGDVSIVGFDDIEFARMIRPKLTTVGMPTAEMGTEAVRRIVELIEAPPENSKRIEVSLPVELIVRESTAPPKAG